MEVKFLDELKSGTTAQIHKLPEGRRAHQRLSEMGLREGMTINVKNVMPMKGPVLITIGQSQIALGHGTASKIKVKVKK
ncbi:MAG: ferrous iron transport protein A [Clostridiales bacterium]|nr:ferrous iron transport protein A [Clostridiales bacterium]